MTSLVERIDVERCRARVVGYWSSSESRGLGANEMVEKRDAGSYRCPQQFASLERNEHISPFEL